MIYNSGGMRHRCWSLVIVNTERGRQVGDVVLHHGLPRSRGSPVYRQGHGEGVFACASTLVRRGEYRGHPGRREFLNAPPSPKKMVMLAVQDSPFQKTSLTRFVSPPQKFSSSQYNASVGVKLLKTELRSWF